MAQERMVYINGEIVPESEGKVSFRDQGFVTGDAVFDATRTFGGGDIQTTGTSGSVIRFAEIYAPRSGDSPATNGRSDHASASGESTVCWDQMMTTG